jgi:hypothetical protein
MITVVSASTLNFSPEDQMGVGGKPSFSSVLHYYYHVVAAKMNGSGPALTDGAFEFLHRDGQIDQLPGLRAVVPQERMTLVYAHPKAVWFRGSQGPAMTPVPRRAAVPDHRLRPVVDGDLVAELPPLQELAHFGRQERGAAAGVVKGRLVDAGAVHDQEPGGVGAALRQRNAQGRGAVVVLRIHVHAVLEQFPERVEVVTASGEAEQVAACVRGGHVREVVQDVEGLVVPRRDGVPQRRVALRVCTAPIDHGQTKMLVFPSD